MLVTMIGTYSILVTEMYIQPHIAKTSWSSPDAGVCTISRPLDVE